MNDILFFVLVAKELQFTFKKRISGKLEIPVESLGVLMAIRHKASMIQQEIADTLKKDKSAILRHIYGKVLTHLKNKIEAISQKK